MKMFLVIGLLIFAPLVMAQEGGQDRAQDASIEQSARELGRSLRCVVCQNQSIEDSDALLAADMRALVRARLKSGDSPDQVRQFMRERYGDFVLLKPPVQGNTYILWFAPFALIVLAGGWMLLERKGAGAAMLTPLSNDERAQIERLKREQQR